MRLSGRGVKCVRGGREIFLGLDFDATSGEALAVTGPNGAGKTSLLRIIAGQLAMAAGSIDLEGGANVSLLLYRADERLERLNLPDTLKAQHTAHLTAGNVLYSDMGRILASIVTVFGVAVCSTKFLVADLLFIARPPP